MLSGPANTAATAHAQSYSRENPSPHYRELARLYGQMHTQHGGDEAAAVFQGFSLLPHAETVRNLIARTGARTILDYGSGKGQQYTRVSIELPDGAKFANVADFWGVERIACYDPGVAEHSALPAETFDGVVSTDVLEHCPEEDLPWIIQEMVDKANRFVFATVAMYPASKTLANGENAHCTVKPPDWWRHLIARLVANRPQLSYRFELHWFYEGAKVPGQRQPEIIELLAGGVVSS